MQINLTCKIGLHLSTSLSLTHTHTHTHTQRTEYVQIVHSARIHIRAIRLATVVFSTCTLQLDHDLIELSIINEYYLVMILCYTTVYYH